jgi:hypothetical protein
LTALFLGNPPAATTPTTGSQTLSVTITGATDDIKLMAASFSGVNQSSPLDAINTAGGTSGDPSVSMTTGTANDLVTATLSRFGTTDASYSLKSDTYTYHATNPPADPAVIDSTLTSRPLNSSRTIFRPTPWKRTRFPQT